jgi:hypothetical protein
MTWKGQHMACSGGGQCAVTDEEESYPLGLCMARCGSFTPPRKPDLTNPASPTAAHASTAVWRKLSRVSRAIKKDGSGSLGRSGGARGFPASREQVGHVR